jgi:two-component system, OmpR family, phosphate regulon sensor histidine kinase PhoR
VTPSPPGPRWRGWRWIPSAPPRIVAIYVVLGIGWIAFSDRLLDALVPDAELQRTLQTVKGIAFVVFTAAILYLLIRGSERGLRALSAEVRATLDSIADAVLLVDAEGRIVEANRALVQLLGATSKDEVIGPISEWSARWKLRSLDGAPVPNERLASMRVLAGEANPRYDAIVQRADGTDVFVSVSSAPVERPFGRRLAVTVMRDVSPARRLDEAREEFLASAAHEFKTPLAVIKAYAQLMARREPEEAHPLAVIQRQVDRLALLVQHLLDASRLRLDPADGRQERFDLASLGREVVEQLRHATTKHDLRVAAGAAVPVQGDRDRIGRVIATLLENGIRFSPAGGPVDVSIESDGVEAIVSVTDRGLGIPRDRQERVFERYYRAHAGMPDDPGGLGVGLDVSRAIIQRHGGRMWFESVLGEGSTFHFSLPMAAEARA